jgi:hypothetical protein
LDNLDAVEFDTRVPRFCCQRCRHEALRTSAFSPQQIGQAHCSTYALACHTSTLMPSTLQVRFSRPPEDFSPLRYHSHTHGQTRFEKRVFKNASIVRQKPCATERATQEQTGMDATAREEKAASAGTGRSRGRGRGSRAHRLARARARGHVPGVWDAGNGRDKRGTGNAARSSMDTRNTETEAEGREGRQTRSSGASSRRGARARP